MKKLLAILALTTLVILAGTFGLASGSHGRMHRGGDHQYMRGMMNGNMENHMSGISGMMNSGMMDDADMGEHMSQMQVIMPEMPGNLNETEMSEHMKNCPMHSAE